MLWEIKEVGCGDDTAIEVGYTLNPFQIYGRLEFFTLQLILTHTVTRIFKAGFTWYVPMVTTEKENSMWWLPTN